MRRTAKKITLWLVHLVPKSNSSSKLSSVDYCLLSVTTQLNVFKRFRSYAVNKCFIVRCDEHSSLFKTMTMLFKVHITNYNLRPRFFLSLVIQVVKPFQVNRPVDISLPFFSSGNQSPVPRVSTQQTANRAVDWKLVLPRNVDAVGALLQILSQKQF